MPMLPDFRLGTYFSRWEFTARFHLTASDTQTMTVGDLLDLADADGRDRWEALHLGYTQTWGLPALLEAIASTYDQIAAGDVVCFAGASEAVYLAMQALLDPGDHAVVLTPNYQTAKTTPASRRSFREITTAAQVGEDWTPREMRHTFISIMSDNGVPLETIADLVGHKTTIVTQKVYRKQLKPVITTGATTMNTIFGKTSKRKPKQSKPAAKPA